MKKLARTSGGPRSRRGGILVVSLIAVLAVAMASATFMHLSSTLSRRQAHSNDMRRAFYLAEAGLAEAYTGLAEARTGNVGTPDEPAVYGNGLVWVEAEDLGGLVQLEATALCGEGRVTLGMSVRRVEGSIASLGMFSAGDVTVAEGALVDGYDSRAGSYAEQEALGANDGLGLLGSNGSVALGGADSEVDGDVVFGPGEALSGPGTVTGSAEPRLEAASLPDVDLPPLAEGEGIDHAEPVPLLFPPGSAAYESLVVRAGADVVLVGPSTLVLGTLEVEGEAGLAFDTADGSVQLFVEERMELAAGSRLSCSSESPEDVVVQVAGGDEVGTGAPAVVVEATGSLFGTLYAPRATVRLSDEIGLFGAVVADALELAPGAALHYDRALVSAGGLLLPEIVSWRVIDIPDGLAAAGGDPFRLLGLDATALAVLAEAHEDQWLEITYEDLSSVERTYAGWESGFDWSEVQRVLGASRDGSSFAGDPAPEPPPPPATAAMDAILDPDIESSDLKSMLEDMSPLSDFEMIAAIDRSPAMNTSDLKSVLLENCPIAYEDVLLGAIQGGPLESGDLKSVLLASSPLSPPVLQAAIDRVPPMKGGDLASVLDAQ